MRLQRASVAFRGGGVVLSAQTPYDRELVVDFVRDCARAQEDVRLTLGRETWRVERVARQQPLACTQCGRPLRDARCYSAHRHAATCIDCALRATAPATSPASAAATIH